MDKLGEVTIDSSLSLTISYQIDQQLLAKNFTTIIDALRQLQHNQAETQAKLKDMAKLTDLNSLQQKITAISTKVQKIQKNNAAASNDPSNDFLDSLLKRVEKTQSNILDNIKDINLINKQVGDSKKDIQDIKKRLDNMKSNEGSKEQNNNYNINEVADNMNKQMQKYDDRMRALEDRLTKDEELINKLQQQFKKITQNNNSSSTTNNNTNNSLSGVSEQDFEKFRAQMRDKFDNVNKKISSMQSEINHYDQKISYIKDLVDQGGNGLEGEDNEEGKSSQIDNLRKELNQLKKKVEELDGRQRKDVKLIWDELNLLKQQLKKSENIGSKTSIQDEDRNNRKSTIQRDELNDKLNDLIIKVSYLEKVLAGSKNNLNDDKNPQKLPAIGRPIRKKDPNMTGYQQKDKSGISRKDISELKSELQAWIRSLLDQSHGRESMEDLQLRIQEIKKSLQKKADAESTKKGFAFLENKITQLYLFLTEPETEDAMIVRKGFNCLSCSKKVEKLRGKLGPRLNWNNMTSTNYSPPRVGYSKPMGEQSAQKQDDL